ncbi:large subunit terminase [Caudoviricetes sp.]|nr:large subunit terminase [Caudoviricetes sp.]
MSAANRLYPLRYHEVQHSLAHTEKRFATVPAGRRSGKTELAKRKIIVEAIRSQGWSDPRFFAGAPTRDQAKAIYWADLKAMMPRKLLREHPRETDLSLKLWNGAEIYVIGMDKPERIEGRPWNGGILDEYANMKPGAWGENVRPALSDRKGWCWLIGVPEGRNHYYDLDQYARISGDPEWGSFSWPSSDILDPAEIAAAKRQLDPLVYEQEYEASFVNFTGRAYYPFQESLHAKSLVYNPLAPLILCFDFNVEPGVCAIVQEQALPGQYERDARGLIRMDEPIVGTGVIGEVHIPRNSNTPAVCRKIVADWGRHKGPVRCYGDATGGNRGTAKVQGSDWDLIKTELRPAFGDRLNFRVPSHNPSERARVNALNTRLLARDKSIRLMVDPKKAPYVVKDLEGVRLLEGGSGEIDKKATPMLTHVSDALGYYIEREFPTVRRTATVEPLRI